MLRSVGLTLAVAVGVIWVAAGCGSAEKAAESTSGKAARALEPKHAETASAFAGAVAGRNYDLAYAFMSEQYKREIGHEEFVKSISRYRDGYETPPGFSVRASDDDPAQLKDDPVMTLFVGDPAVRAQVRDEAIIDFRVGTDGWTLIAWLIEEQGQVRILNYVQDD
jgi:hypothetical protein